MVLGRGARAKERSLECQAVSLRVRGKALSAERGKLLVSLVFLLLPFVGHDSPVTESPEPTYFGSLEFLTSCQQNHIVRAAIQNVGSPLFPK